MSAARQAFLGASDGAVERQRDRGPSPVIPLLIMVLGLAIATIWFVALPMLNQPAPAKRACEVIVLKSGKTRCVSNPKTKAARQHTKQTKHAKQ